MNRGREWVGDSDANTEEGDKEADVDPCEHDYENCCTWNFIIYQRCKVCGDRRM
jgi:hypothetical protein